VKFRAIAAALAIVAVPVAINGAGAQQKTNPQRKVCNVQSKTGSRLGATTSCLTPAERTAMRAEARRTVERIQEFKPTLCSPPGNC
jgi:hypothetical protein